MPVILEKRTEENAQIGVWKIEEDADELLGMLQLDGEERQYLEKIQSSKRYLHWLSSRVMLRQLLHTDEFIQLRRENNGRPFIENFPHHLSIAHSHDMAAVLINKHYRVGVDIEQINQKVDRIKSKFLSPDELSEIDPGNSIEHLIQCWCAKEALFKLYGKGNVDFIHHLHLQHYDYKECGRMEASILKDDFLKKLVVHYEKVRNYMLAYVVDEF